MRYLHATLPVFLGIILLFVETFALTGCGAFHTQSAGTFREWMVGKPGIYGALYGKNGVGALNVNYAESRKPYFLWFRTFDLIVNPYGGLHYPEMSGNKYFSIWGWAPDMLCLYSGAYENSPGLKGIFPIPIFIYPFFMVIFWCGYLCQTKSFEAQEYSVIFYQQDAGIMDYVIPYRAVSGKTEKDRAYGLLTWITKFDLLISIPHFCSRAVVYPIHDVLKTLAVLPAWIVYSVKDEPETASTQ
ncbi:hypothetical protein JW926_06455 [Candidatus Sumerlaeota bacterium]|nr:hypothetical protein [Candidatus Sumerlaeota bacterium]